MAWTTDSFRHGWQRRGQMWVVLSLVAIVVAIAITLVPLAAAADGPSDAGLGVLGALAEYDVTPGQSLKHTLTVSLGPGAKAPADVLVEVAGLGQTPEGATVALSEQDDNSPYSARRLIKVDRTSFRLTPGGSQVVNVDIAVPKDLGQASRYGDIYIHTRPMGDGAVASILAFHVPVILNPAGVSLAPQGKITDVQVAKVVSGKPLQITTTFVNTGLRHYKIQGLVILTDPNGNEIARQSLTALGNSVAPGFPRAIGASINLLDKLQGLPAGKYGVESHVIGPDGKPIDSKRTTFDLVTPYQLFPGIDPASLVVVTLNDEEPKAIDARAKADVLLTFSGTGRVTGTVVTGKYRQEPGGSPRFADGLDKLGMAKPGIKFVAVGVDGFSQGTAQVGVTYSQAELLGRDPNGLFLAFRVGDRWTKLDHLVVQTGAQMVVGEIPVAVLQQNPVIAMGADAPVAAAVAVPAATPARAERPTPAGWQLPLGVFIPADSVPYVAGGAGLIAVGLAASFLITRPKGRPSRGAAGVARRKGSP